ncbi:MAG: sensor histidine kinase [Thermodesulfobacteriota bacterium]
MDKNILLEAVIREMRTGVLVLDGAGKVLYANPFFVNSFPVTGGVEGRPVKEIIRNRTLLGAVLGFKGAPSGESDEIEVSEGQRAFNIRIMPFKEDGGSSLLLFLRDVTEEKRVETIKKDFVANVSHELRTPLASIKGYSETLLDGGIDGKRRGEFLRVIDRHATRMSRIIDDLLILSRLETERLSMVSNPVDLKDLITSTVRGFDKQARDREIGLKTRIPEDLPGVSGDSDRIEQVVVNLLDNAIKYTPAGGSVRVSAGADDGYVRVEVSDTGIGIPSGDIARIFERFYRVDKARSRDLGGTGLGLAIVKHIIQGHNGKLHVESTPGRGSTFSFSLASIP